MELGKNMMAAGKKGIFDAWMYECSDLVQHAARAYGERLVSERCSAAIGSADESIAPMLTQLQKLFAVNILSRNLGWFITNGAISVETGKQVAHKSSELCKVIGPQALALTDAFGVTDNMLSAPIGLDWIEYNEYDNQGELRT